MVSKFYILIKVKDKINFNKNIKKILKQNRFKVNQVFKDQMDSKLEFTSDKMIEGYINNLSIIYKLIKMISKDISKFINIILIEYNENINEKLILNLLNQVKKERILFLIKTHNEVFDNLISNNINLIYLIKDSYTPKKVKIITEYERLKDQQLVADNLNMSQQQVSYHLKTAYWKQLKNIELSINICLNEYKF